MTNACGRTSGWIDGEAGSAFGSRVLTTGAVFALSSETGEDWEGVWVDVFDSCGVGCVTGYTFCDLCKPVEELSILSRRWSSDIWQGWC